MILLDTNVVSEAMKPNPDMAVSTWLDGQVVESLFLSAISLAELRRGIALLPKGRRQDGLQKALDDLVPEYFQSRILTFDGAAANAYATIHMKARQAGRAIGVADGFIAAIAVAHGLTFATRDVSPFEAAGLKVLNPWL